LQHAGDSVELNRTCLRRVPDRAVAFFRAISAEQTSFVRENMMLPPLSGRVRAAKGSDTDLTLLLPPCGEPERAQKTDQQAILSIIT